MPATEIRFFRNRDGVAPVVEWLRKLQKSNRKAFANCRSRLFLLRAFGFELRRPHVDYLRDGIYEIRAKEKRVQHRLLYFYHGKNMVIVAHGLTKERDIPEQDLNAAVARKNQYAQDPTSHTADEEVEDL